MNYVNSDNLICGVRKSDFIDGSPSQEKKCSNQWIKQMKSFKPPGDEIFEIKC